MISIASEHHKASVGFCAFLFRHFLTLQCVGVDDARSLAQCFKTSAGFCAHFAQHTHTYQCTGIHDDKPRPRSALKCLPLVLISSFSLIILYLHAYECLCTHVFILFRVLHSFCRLLRSLLLHQGIHALTVEAEVTRRVLSCTYVAVKNLLTSLQRGYGAGASAQEEWHGFITLHAEGNKTHELVSMLHSCSKQKERCPFAWHSSRNKTHPL